MKLLTLTLANLFTASAKTKLDSELRLLQDDGLEKSPVEDPVGPATEDLIPNGLLEAVEDDEQNVKYWIMAPKPGYKPGKFDLGKDELMILYSDTADSDIAEGESEFSLTAEFWNIDGDRFNTDTCNMTLTDSDGDTYWDSFAIAEDEDNCQTYGGRSGLI